MIARAAFEWVAGQAPVPVPVPVEGGPDVAMYVIIAVFFLFLALGVWAIRRRNKARGPAPKQLQSTQQLTPSIETGKPPELVVPKVTLPPSELEAQKKAEAEAARRQAETLRNKLAELEARKTRADEGERAEIDRAQQKLRDEAEGAKREAYRAEKAAEVEEKERKKREREEAARLAAEEVQRQAAETARLAAEQQAAQAKKVEAEAGQTLAHGLAKTKREGFMARLSGLFGGAPRVVDESVLAELEEVLFTADIGVKTASRLVEHARDQSKTKSLGSAELKSVIREEVERIVTLKANHSLSGGGSPHVIMVVGVNGAGKTTTIGKLAAKAAAQGKKVLLGAGDTFRAAAAEQLDVWAERAGAELVKGKDEADPASVVFDAVKQGVERKVDLVIADTAGRLHTKANLMEELKKVKRVIEKALPGAPHEVLLVLDSTNGQNAIMQARQFHDAVGITAIALTKLDGTARGGVIIGICDDMKVPVSWVGIGEKVSDLRPFDPKEFVAALFD
ncbi:MAG: signal recognition particle-docking protein FtsY [Archangium sp.]|nr:signal recognition particle-docking protein FtsY [Archangium sp.]MDP3575816.1 signal recognition particle-docking protein FtsY [Archangium sp.]